MNVHTILVPLDGSINGEAALPYAEAIARLTGAPIRLFRAVEGSRRVSDGSAYALRDYVERGRLESANEELHAAAAKLRDRGLEVSLTLQPSDAVDGILAAAADPEIGLIAMATHGRGGVSRLVLGSIADKVMRLAPRPTLIIRSDENANLDEPVTLRRILVPLDGSRTAEAALEPACLLAAAAAATIVLIRVEPWLTSGVTEVSYVANLPADEDEVTRAIDGYLQDVQRALPKEIPSEKHAVRGYLRGALEEAYRELRADLVVMTTQGRGGARRLVLGSTADRLVRAGLPVLLIRPDTAGATEFTERLEQPAGTPPVTP